MPGQQRRSLGPEKVLYEQREFPPVVQETIIPQEKKEFQQVIHREVIVPEVHRITQPYFEQKILPHSVQERQLPSVFHEIPRGGQNIPTRDIPQSSMQRQPVETQFVEKPPIVVETVKKVLTTEIQPVIYREVVEPQIIREMRPMYERFVEQPTEQVMPRGQFPSFLQPVHHHHPMHNYQQGQFPQQGQQGQLYHQQGQFPQQGQFHQQGQFPQQGQFQAIGSNQPGQFFSPFQHHHAFPGYGQPYGQQVMWPQQFLSGGHQFPSGGQQFQSGNQFQQPGTSMGTQQRF